MNSAYFDNILGNTMSLSLWEYRNKLLLLLTRNEVRDDIVTSNRFNICISCQMLDKNQEQVSTHNKIQILKIKI